MKLKALLSLSGIKTAWKRPVPARTDSSQLLKITTCEKSVSFIRLHFPGSTRPTGLSLRFSRDLHLIPPCRTRLDSTWVLLGLWPRSRVSWATPLPVLGRRPGVGFILFGTSPSCLNLTDFLILKAASDPDSTTSFMFVPGFFLFLRTPKQEQSFRDRRLYMAVWLLQDPELHCGTSYLYNFPSCIYKQGKSRLQWWSGLLFDEQKVKLHDVVETTEEAFPRFCDPVCNQELQRPVAYAKMAPPKVDFLQAAKENVDRYAD